MSHTIQAGQVWSMGNVDVEIVEVRDNGIVVCMEVGEKWIMFFTYTDTIINGGWNLVQPAEKSYRRR